MSATDGPPSKTIGYPCRLCCTTASACIFNSQQQLRKGQLEILELIRGLSDRDLLRALNKDSKVKSASSGKRKSIRGKL